MDLLQTSKKLSEENKALEDFTRRLEAYIFSSKIRPLVFGYKFGDERKKVLFDLIQRLNNAKNNITKLRTDIDGYYGRIKHSNIFMQKKHFRLAKRFVYNALTNTTYIERSIKRIIKDLDSIKIAKNPNENQGLFHSIKKEFNSVLKYFNENHVLLSDIQGRLQIQEKIVMRYSGLKKHLIDQSDLKTGDILISFKSKDYLKNVLISRTISRITSSQVTHVLLAIKISQFKIKIVDSHQATGGVRLREFEIFPGEVFIVLRPRMSHHQRAMLLNRIRGYVKNKTGYSKSKLMGALPTFLIIKFINMFSSGYKHIPNILALKSAEFFCSEFINQIFKEVGILLTPKSKYSSMVYPSDIVVSPFVDYIGLIFEDSERSEKIIARHLSDIKI